MKKHASLLAAPLLALALAVTGCGGSTEGGGDGASTADRLAEAKKTLDETEGVRIKLSAPKLPSSVSGVLSAEGIGNHQPAFDGKIKAFQSGLSLTVPVIAVDDKVYVNLGSWQAIDPKQFSAPDPAALMSPDAGLSSILTEATGVSAGKEARDGKDKVTTFTGKIPGKVMTNIIPSASDSTDFAAKFTLNQDNELVKATMTGEFYPDTEDITYTLTFTDYGTSKTIKAP